MTDLGGERVLVGRRFCYFGGDAIPFPDDVSFRTPARFNRVNFTNEERGRLQEFLEDLPQGIQGKPRNWPKDDGFWRESERCG